MLNLLDKKQIELDTSLPMTRSETCSSFVARLLSDFWRFSRERRIL